MVVLGIDAHKRTHTVVAVDLNGRQLAVRTRSVPRPRITLHCCGGPTNSTPARRSGGGRSRTAGTCRAGSNVTCS